MKPSLISISTQRLFVSLAMNSLWSGLFGNNKPSAMHYHIRLNWIPAAGRASVRVLDIGNNSVWLTVYTGTEFMFVENLNSVLYDFTAVNGEIWENDAVLWLSFTCSVVWLSPRRIRFKVLSFIHQKSYFNVNSIRFNLLVRRNILRLNFKLRLIIVTGLNSFKTLIISMSFNS
jgi:hypothetical protein